MIVVPTTPARTSWSTHCFTNLYTIIQY